MESSLSADAGTETEILLGIVFCFLSPGRRVNILDKTEDEGARGAITAEEGEDE